MKPTSTAPRHPKETLVGKSAIASITVYGTLFAIWSFLQLHK